MHSITIRRWLLCWGLVLVAIFALALLRRHLVLLALAEDLAAQLRPVAEQGAVNTPHDDWDDPELDSYIYGDYDGVSYTPAMQGPAIYLFSHGYRNPELMRAVLLLEARRCYDWQYTYPRVRNNDLRQALIRNCTRLYPADLRVFWASGQLELAAGEWDAAAQHLGAVVQACGSMQSLREFGVSIGRMGRNVLGRYAAALTLCGRDAEAGELLKMWHLAAPEDRDVNWALSHWLLDNGEFEAVMDLLLPADGHAIERTLDAEQVVAAALEGQSSGRHGTLEFLQSQWDMLEQGGPEVDAAWDVREQYEAQRCTEASRLARALMYAGRWDEARLLIESGDFNPPWDSKLLAEHDCLRLLCRIAEGRKLQASAAETKSGVNPNSDETAGELAGALEGEFLAAALRSPLFDAALKARACSFEQIKMELHAAIHPQRDDYWDMSNGQLNVQSW